MAEAASPTLPITAKTLAVALLIAVLGVRYHTSSILHGLGASPELPLATLAILAALHPLLQRILRLSRADIIVVYCFVLVAAAAYDGVSRWMPAYTVPQYFAEPENRFQMLSDEYVPGWFVPKDAELIRRYYEGADGPVDWRPWLAPVALWTLFFMALWGTLYCVVALLRKQWVEHERLGFPLVLVPLYIAGVGSPGLRAPKCVWREPLMWLGFSLATLHFLSIMVHALNPRVPTLGTHFDVGRLFTERPLDALRPLFLFIYNPLLAGLAYFAPQDLTFSMWFFFLFYFKPIHLVYRVAGLPQASGFPFYWEQSAGAFVAIALCYAWAARGYLKAVWEAALSGRSLSTEDPLSPRLAVGGAICGFAALCLWYYLAGMTWWVAAVFFGLIILFATIFTRGRAESGVAYTASFPFWQASRQIKSFLGSERLMPGGSYANLTLLGSLIFLHFGSFPEGMTFQIETLRLGEQSRIRTSHMTALIFGAMLVGLLVNFHTFLTVGYEWGSNTLQGGTTEGGYHVAIARQEYNEVSAIAKGQPLAPDWTRNGFTLGAFCFTLLLVALRARFPRSPFHPLGFVMTTSYGYAYWGSFLTVWAIKAAILRLGGVRLYHRLAPIFVGLVLGQIFSLSVVWMIFAQFTSDEWKQIADPLIYF
jgi:Family of unknown function (DUF6785)/Domain of unknown function (DUF6784)